MYYDSTHSPTKLSVDISWVTYHLPVCPKFGPGRNVTDMWDLDKTCGKNLHHEIRKYFFVVVEEKISLNVTKYSQRIQELLKRRLLCRVRERHNRGSTPIVPLF